MGHPVAPDQQGMQPQAGRPYPPYGLAPPPPPPKKPRAGLIVGIIAAAVALAIAVGGVVVASALFFLRAGDELPPDADIAYQSVYGYPFAEHRVYVLISGIGQAEITWSVQGEETVKQIVALPWQHTIAMKQHDFKVALIVRGVGESPSVQRCTIDIDGDSSTYRDGKDGSVQCAAHFTAG